MFEGGMSMSDATERLWGARFKSGPAEAMANLSRSPAAYFRMTPYDVAGSKAHAHELERAGLLDAEETQRIIAALHSIDEDFAAGKVQPIAADEDVHTFIERLLTERLGALGGKLRAGRSRNDQTANDMRLFLRDRIRLLTLSVLDLQQARQHHRARLHAPATGAADCLRPPFDGSRPSNSSRHPAAAGLGSALQPFTARRCRHGRVCDCA
jgi:argininosuccinate lyase